MSEDFFDTNAAAIKFNKIGDGVRGTITKVPKSQMRENKFTKRDEEVLAIALDCDAVPDGEKGERTLWVRNPSFLRSAIRDALAATQTKWPEVGATLAVKYTKDEDTGKGNPAKVFEAKYTAPVGGPSEEDIF